MRLLGAFYFFERSPGRLVFWDVFENRGDGNKFSICIPTVAVESIPNTFSQILESMANEGEAVQSC